VPKVDEEHRERRRRQITEGARRAFARFGYEGATVARLEEETGLSRGAIFSYYPSKLDLFLALAEEGQRRLLRIWLDDGFEGVLRDAAESPEWIAINLDVPRMLRDDEELRTRWQQFNPALQAQLSEHFVRQQAAGALRSDLDVDTLGNFHGALLDGLAIHIAAGFPIDVEGTLELLRSAVAPK
jgi:AcrR family transcriptional regulator